MSKKNNNQKKPTEKEQDSQRKAVEKLCRRWQTVLDEKVRCTERGDEDGLSQLDELLREHLQTGRAYEKIDEWLDRRRMTSRLLLPVVLKEFLQKSLKDGKLDFDGAAKEHPDLISEFMYHGHIDLPTLRGVLIDCIDEAISDGKSTEEITGFLLARLGHISERAALRRFNKYFPMGE